MLFGPVVFGKRPREKTTPVTYRERTPNPFQLFGEMFESESRILMPMLWILPEDLKLSTKTHKALSFRILATSTGGDKGGGFSSGQVQCLFCSCLPLAYEAWVVSLHPS